MSRALPDPAFWMDGKVCPHPHVVVSLLILSTEYILGAGVEQKNISRKAGRRSSQQGECKVASLQDGPARVNLRTCWRYRMKER